MENMRKIAICLALGLVAVGALAATHSSATAEHAQVERLSRRSVHGKIAVKACGRHFPGNAKISFARTRSEKARGKVVDGLAKKWRARHGGKRHAKAPSPRVLAMYDVSIDEGGRKWQPKAGEPVRVEMELDEPVQVTAASSLGVVHLADDGEVEELDSSRYGFTYNADKTAVTAFWFSATGFSIYSIIDNSGVLVTPRRFYHFYDHPADIAGSNAVQAFPYRYTDASNDVVNVQIVKSGDELKEPPVPEETFDEFGNIESVFEGWYVVQAGPRPSGAAESKLDSMSEPFVFVWPTGVTDNRLSFTNAVTVTESADWDYYVAPLFEHARYLQFNENEMADQDAAAHIVDRKIIAINDETGIAHIRVNDVSAALKNSRNEYFSGWQYVSGVDPATGANVISNLIMYSAAGLPQEAFIDVDRTLFDVSGGDTINLYPLYVSAHFLNFDTNAKGTGATYVGSRFVRSTSEINEVDPSGNRRGYNFDGWCMATVDGNNVTLGTQVTDDQGRFYPNLSVADEEGTVVLTTDANGNVHLNSDVTLFAKWTANTSAPYRVIIWQQRVTDAKDAAEADKLYYYVTHYTSPAVSATTQVSESLLTSFTGTAAKGANPSNANLTTLSGKGESNITGEDFTGFHYARFASDDATVAPDGTTVINVYYDRDLITLRFCTYGSSNVYSPVGDGYVDGTQYGSDGNGGYVQLYYDAVNNLWYTSRTLTRYNGDRYYYYNGNWYRNASSYYTPQYNSDRTVQLVYENNDWYLPSYSGLYEGTRYVLSRWTVNQTMTGLYGQRLSANGYTWPSDRRWYDGFSGSSTAGTQISFLDAFLPTTGGDETFYSTTTTTTSSNNTKVYFYTEALDGSWTLANEFDSGSSSVNFNISDKYNGFHAYQYSTDGGSSWRNVGSYDESTGYYGSQVSASRLSIRFKRNSCDLVFMDGENFLLKSGEEISVPFEGSLAAYNLPYTDSRFDWGDRDLTVGTFAGWYEDASLTVPFDFSATMPSGTKFLYAKWNPIKYRVIIDPNGGELQMGDSTWFYLDAGEKIVEYSVTRKYRLDMHLGTFYYSYHPWDPLGDKHVTPTDSPDFIPNISRRAYYTDDIDDATDKVNRYTYDPGAYAFMGWYEVLEDGTLASDPFNFAEPPDRPVTIRAIWRRTSVYTLRFESIDPDGTRADDVIVDPAPGSSAAADGGYIDDGQTTIAREPTNYDRNRWIWEGWQTWDVHNNIPLTNIRSPGDPYIVHAAHADYRDNVIHFRAVYRSKEDTSSRHIPNVVDLALDANDGATLSPEAATVVPAASGRIGTYAQGTGPLEGLGEGVWFAGQQNNFSVNLADYTAAFVHTNGFLLLGWDSNRVSTTGIPAYYVNETIGVDKSAAYNNILYAVWEPQIYLEFVNDTVDALHNIQLDIPAWAAGELFRVNTVLGETRRQAFTNFVDGTAIFDLAAGERLRLVLPDGKHMRFAVTGTSPYADGTKLIVTRTSPAIEGEAQDADYVSTAYAGESYLVTGLMHISPTPVTVTFTKATYPTQTEIPVRYFVHSPSGTVTEITQDATCWNPGAAYKTNLTVSATPMDLAATLRKSEEEPVHAFLVDNIQTNYGHTTIGIGAATGGFNEYRSITKRATDGGSWVMFSHERVQWSRYSQVWNSYDDPAVYVVFYHRIPVHVTVGKNVVGTEDDKSREFSFSAAFAEHSDTYEYQVTNTYVQTRYLVWSRKKTNSSNWTQQTPVDWDKCEPEITAVTNALVKKDEDQYLFSPTRAEETFRLADKGRLPVTLFYNELLGNAVDGPAQTEETEARYNEYASSLNGPWYSGTSTGYLYRRRLQTRTTVQTTTHLLTYQYETVTVTEATDDLFDLSSIAGDTSDPNSNHGGTGNLNARTYTISSIKGPDAKGFYHYQDLDTVIFTNSRKHGSLTVSKAVEGAKAEDAGDTFTFIATMSESVRGWLDPAAAGVSMGPYGKVLTFTLPAGGSKTFDLPVGVTYTVEEGANHKYVIPSARSGAISAGSASAPFVNMRKTDVVIVMSCRTNYFNGVEQVGSAIHEVTGTGSPIETADYSVTGLKAGHVLTVSGHVPARGTTVGEYSGHFENAVYAVRDSATGEDVTGEYLFYATPTTLTILPSPIVVTITGSAVTKTYNGETQSAEGYSYTVTNAETGDSFTGESIFVVVEPQRQTAWGKDVGTYPMTIAADAVVVTVPEGYSVSEIVVAQNGSLTITPAPVTVAADDKAKLLGFADPALTATVTGLFGSDTVSYSLSRASGEAVGTYAITPVGDAAQGNYAVTYQAGTLTIREVSLVQRSTGEGHSVKVVVPAEAIAALGIGNSGDVSPEAIEAAFNAYDPNGLRRWENLVTGTATNQLILGSGVGTSASQMSFGLYTAPRAAIDLGYLVSHDLRKNVNGGWTRVAGPVAGLDPSITLDLLDGNGKSTGATGFYRVFTLIVPEDELSITNEIPSTNIIGVLEVKSMLKTTMTAVPWTALAHDPSIVSNMVVSGYMKPAQLAVGDTLHAITGDGVYQKYTVDSSGNWTNAAATITRSGTVVTPPACERELVRGNAVWIKREDTSKPYFLVGQYAGGDVVTSVAGSSDGSTAACTMITNPNLTDMDINDFTWGSNPTSKDVVWIPNGKKTPITLRWKNGKWGKYVVDTVLMESVWKTDFTVPSGTGFWYNRYGPAFNVTIPFNGPDED